MNKEDSKSYTKTIDDQLYSINLSIETEKLNLNIFNTTIKPVITYQEFYSIDKFKSIDKLFNIYDNVSEIKDDVDNLLSTDEYTLIPQEDGINLILFYKFNNKIKNITLPVPSIKSNQEIIIKDLCNTVMNLSVQQKKLIEENEKKESRLKKIETFLCNYIEFPISSTIFSNLIQYSYQMDLLKKWADIKKGKLTLAYKGSLNGFSSKYFYLKNEELGKTFFLFQNASNQKVFGGYTSKLLLKDGEYQIEPKAFVFSLTERIKYPVKELSKAIKYCSDSFVRFGSDLVIYDKPQSTNNYSGFPNSYGENSLDKFSLTGEEYFKLSEVEIYFVSLI